MVARVVTVEGVLVEAAHLLGGARGAAAAALNLVRSARERFRYSCSSFLLPR
jgi:hypothetical protein